ncbi:BRCA1 C terminus domain-containing protein [Biscogniauxia mediterranea]|nr:BRCA1 C terminus domain-containing protein [Biscogniauxia mediterranea]
MPSPPKQTTIKTAADPKYGQSFDPWNSSSTGHQRAENRLGASTGWRESRNVKLMSQFKGGAGGGKRVSDSVGAGSKDWDAKAKALIPPELRFRAQNSVMDMLRRPGTMNSTLTPAGSNNPKEGGSGIAAEEGLEAQGKAGDEAREAERGRPRRIFDGVVVYVNGSTHPLISDHKLKHVLADHGGRLSSHLGRRQVTHVIVGRPAGGVGAGAGGGLAGGKLQREIQKVRGCGVKFVGVEWILESIKVGKRLPEAGFGPVKVASKGQQSVYSLCSKKDPPTAGIDDSKPPPSGQGSGQH